MKTTAEKSKTTSVSKNQGQPFLPKAGQPGFFSATGIQTKLTINTPGDEFEKEADQTAEQVTQSKNSSRKTEKPVIRKKADTSTTVPVSTFSEMEEEPEASGEVQRQSDEQEEVIIQRQTEETEEEGIQRQTEDTEEEVIQRQAEDTEEEVIQRQEESEEDTIQRKNSGGQTVSTAPPIVGSVLSSSGSKMEKSTRTDMEGRFGSDFSNVRIHKDNKAADSSKAISAKAYTFGNHIVFNSGQYSPNTKAGKKLLAHELTHVVQQGGGVKRAPESTPSTLPEPSSTVQNNSSATTPPVPASPPINSGNNTSNSPGPPSGNNASSGSSPLAEASGGSFEGESEAVIIEPIMSEPPSELSAEEQGRINQVRSRTGSNAEATTDLPTESENTDSARAGVTEPPQETTARASGALVAELGLQPQPSPEIEELCEHIKSVIENKRPPDEDSLLRSDPEEAADEAGAQLNDNIESDTERVEDNYNSLEENPEGSPEQIGQPIEPSPENVNGPNINATNATPNAVPDEEVNLDADVENTSAQIEEGRHDITCRRSDPKRPGG